MKQNIIMCPTLLAPSRTGLEHNCHFRTQILVVLSIKVAVGHRLMLEHISISVRNASGLRLINWYVGAQPLTFDQSTPHPAYIDVLMYSSSCMRHVINNGHLWPRLILGVT